MNPFLVKSSKPLTLVGGGECSSADLKLALSLAPTCVAADSGAEIVLEEGVALAAVIGDMDSISEASRAQIPSDRFHLVAEQDSTDFDKALRCVSAPVVIAIGFTGGQIDHAMAALNTLVMRCDRSVVLLGVDDVVFLCPKAFSLDMPAGTRVSLFPMGPVTGHSKGLHWPIDGIDFAPGMRSGTSNRATGDIYLKMDSPRMLCILPRRFIGPVVSLLSVLPDPVRWLAP